MYKYMYAFISIQVHIVIYVGKVKNQWRMHFFFYKYIIFT